MGRKSKDKGARGERELATELHRLFGVTARRGVQYRGGVDSPDVITDIEGIHFEVKRTERLSLYPAMQQAVNDAGGKIPVVCHRANGKEWLAIVRLNDLPKLTTALEIRNCEQSTDGLDNTKIDYPFEQEWQAHQAAHLPQFTKPKKALGIGLDELPPLNNQLQQ